MIGCGVDITPEIPSDKSVYIDSDTNSNIDLEGYYTLESGHFVYIQNSSINKKVNSSDLVIEKLDSNDYGYYFTLQVEDLSPTMSFGIIHRDNGDFFKKIIYTQGMTEDNNMTEGETVDENLTTRAEGIR